MKSLEKSKSSLNPFMAADNPEPKDDDGFFDDVMGFDEDLMDKITEENPSV
jgi:hypothetical protein